jgi:hypothetical protein
MVATDFTDRSRLGLILSWEEEHGRRDGIGLGLGDQGSG